MAMTMHKRADSLRRLGMVLRGTASDPLHEQLLCSKRVFPLHDFFVAALTANKVTSLSCRVDNPHHLAFLVNSVRQLTSNGVVMPSQYTELNLHYEIDRHPAPNRENWTVGIAPLLRFCSQCYSLHTLKLSLPSICWEEDDTERALRQLLENKPCLSYVNLFFSVFYDKQSKLLKTISDSLSSNIARKMDRLTIYGLLNVNQCDDTTAGFNAQCRYGVRWFHC